MGKQRAALDFTSDSETVDIEELAGKSRKGKNVVDPETLQKSCGTVWISEQGKRPENTPPPQEIAVYNATRLKGQACNARAFPRNGRTP